MYVWLQECSAVHNTNSSIDLKVEGIYFFRLLPLLSQAERHIFRQDINGRNPWSNYSTSAVHGSNSNGEKKGASGYLCLFLFTEQLLQPFPQPPSSCLGNNQSGVAEAWRREMYSGGVVGNYKRNQFNEFPPSMEKMSINQACGQTQTTTF